MCHFGNFLFQCTSLYGLLLLQMESVEECLNLELVSRKGLAILHLYRDFFKGIFMGSRFAVSILVSVYRR